LDDLLSWMNQPSATRGLRFLNDSGEWSFESFAAIVQRAHSIAGLLRDAALRNDDIVAIVLPTGSDFVATIFATWIAGGTICPLAPPMMFENEHDYVEHAGRILGAARPRIAITDKTFRPLMTAAAAAGSVAAATVLDVGDSTVAHSGAIQGPATTALLQFTSGSSGSPRGVKVSVGNLIANIAAIRRWIDMGSSDATATWLPLYHDMGLIGCLLTPIVNRSDVWIMRPDQFVRDPTKWLECFGRHGASLSAAPNFGYGYAARKVANAAVADMDFSEWRVAIAGAEPVEAGALRRFSDKLSAFGFSSRAYLPAYGLAEATLAVTGRPPTAPVAQAVQLDWATLSFGEHVRVLAESCLDDLDVGASSGWLVSSGSPHTDTTVSILSSGGEPLPSDTLGEILVHGPSVASGYIDSRTASTTTFTQAGVLTGDAGFVHKGELYVVGRIADSLKVRGRTVYAEDLEARVAVATTVPRGRFVIIAVPGQGSGAILGLGEDVEPSWAAAAAELIKAAVGSSISVRVGVVPRGSIRRTSSGKPRRRVMWELAQRGEIVMDHITSL